MHNVLPNPSSKRWRIAAIMYLTLQGMGGAAWLTMLLCVPRTREWFVVRPAPDATLLAFAVPDGLLFVGGSLAVAYGLALRKSWAWPTLCAHAGAAVYAALYCWTLALLAGKVWAGAILMTPSLLLPPLFVWTLRPKEWMKERADAE